MSHPGRLYSQLKAAAELWEEIENTPYPADRYLGNFFHQHRKKFGSRDRRFIAETIYSLFRHKSFLQFWAERHGSENSQFLVTLAAAAEGFLSEEEFDQILNDILPASSKSENFYRVLKNHTLPKLNLSFEDTLALQYSFPRWLVEKWLQQFGEDQTRELLQASQARPPFVVRANTLKIERKKLLEILHKKGFEVCLTDLSDTAIHFKERANLFDTEEFRNGYFEVQDEGSQLLCQNVDPQPGEIIWDVCAGGGGKTLALAARMNNKGRIIATDIRAKKLEDLRKRAARAGVNNVFPADLERMDEIHALKKGADKIVVDAPCSGTGTLRRNPDAKWKLKPEIFQTNHRDELAILEKSLPYLKVGGKIFYMTCSLESEENESVVGEFLEKHPELKVAAYPRSRDGFFRLMPHKHPTDGFFLAILEKTK